MPYLINWKEYSLISLILFLVNLINWPQSAWHWLLGGLLIIWLAIAFGNCLPGKNSLTFKILIGLFLILALASIILTAFFYFWQITLAGFIVSLLIITLISSYLVVKRPLLIELPNKLRFKYNPWLLILTLIYLFFCSTFYFILLKSATNSGIRSPWEVIPNEIFIIYFLATVTLFVLTTFTESKKILLLICLHFFASFSVAVLIYQIGFDYDPFIHRTNEQLIATFGSLNPKPLYYIGQYGLIYFLNQLLHWPLVWLDKLLVPLLAAIYLPITIYYSVRDNFKIVEKYALLLTISLLGLGYANFISTTPQSLANLLLIITLLITFYLIFSKRFSVWPSVILGIFCLIIHPLAGLPCLFFVILTLIYHHFQKKFPFPKILQRAIFWETVILATLALPIAFLINSQTLSQLKVVLNDGLLKNLSDFLIIQNWSVFYQPFISIFDAIYTFGKNLTILYLILAVLGMVFVFKNKKFKHFSLYPLTSLILLINYLFLIIGINFFSLVSYEQRNYPDRVLELSLYLLLPFVIMTIYSFFKKLFQQKKIVIFLTFLILSLFLTFSFYLSYPRVDTIQENHGYSTSITDLKTVNFLEKLNRKTPYIVLASQPVSAAAIKELGFKHYYQNYFFYPVPTGGQLYQLYEDLAYQKKTAEQVINEVYQLTGVETIYFVLNDYWFDAQTIITEHKKTANDWYAIDGKDYIFKYLANQPSLEQLSSAN